MTDGIDRIDPVQGAVGTTGQVAARLRDAIASGQIRPGTRLLEPKLASQLGVSRTPVREALSRLEAEGLIKRVQYRGAIVVELTAEQVVESYMLRTLLEGHAAKLATPRLSEEDLSRIRALIDEIKEAIEQGRSQKLDALHREFHRAIYSQCGSAKLISWIQELYNQFPKNLRRTSRLEEPISECLRILDALQARDADLAGNLMSEHITNGAVATEHYYAQALSPSR